MIRVSLLLLLVGIAVCGAFQASPAFSLPHQRSAHIAKRWTTSTLLQRQSISPQLFVQSTWKSATSRLMSAPAGNRDVIITEIVDSKPAEAKKTLIDKIWNDNTKMATYLGVWYLGNIFYNICNKKASIALGKDALGHANAHWTLSAFQLLVGTLLVLPMWLTGARAVPSLTLGNWVSLAPIGLFAALSHAFSVMALSAGAVAFGQIVKAGEPVFAAATNALLLKDIDHPYVYLSLLPIIMGVGLASLKELSFTWTALVAALLANLAAALKNVASKGVMTQPWFKTLGPQNTYAVINLLALICTLPMVLYFESSQFSRIFNQVVASGNLPQVVFQSLYSGLAFYVYNEASFLALAKMSPITHSVANTLKRVVIIIASCIVFQSPMSLLGGIGSAVAVLGTLTFSLAKKKYQKNPNSNHH